MTPPPTTTCWIPYQPFRGKTLATNSTIGNWFVVLVSFEKTREGEGALDSAERHSGLNDEV